MFIQISLLILIVAVPTHQASDLIIKTCDQTLYKDYCKSILGSDLGNDAKDLQGLTSFALNMALTKGNEIKKKIDQLWKTSREETLLQCLDDCSDNYQDAIDQIGDSIKALGAKGYNDINTWVTAAMTDAQSCHDGFKDVKGVQLPLGDVNTHFSQLCSIILAMSNLLVKG